MDLDLTPGGHTRRCPASRPKQRRFAIVLAIALLAAALAFGAGCTSGATATNNTGSASTAVTAAGSATTATAAVTTAGTVTGSGTTGSGPTIVAGPVTSTALVSPAQAVAAKVGPSVVNIRVSSGTTATTSSQFPGGGQQFPGGGQQFSGVGSGVVYSSDGYIVTNDHVVAENGVEASSIEVTFSSGETVSATIVARDTFTDLAVIKVDKSNLPAATFARSADVQVGQYAIAIGSPSDYSNSVTLGIVSGLNRTLQESSSPSLVDLIQTDAAISPGNSGGALLDADGRVIGISVAYLPPASTGAENIGFAIPADTVVGIVQELIAQRKASHPYLGVQYTSVTTELQQADSLSRSSGALVQQVMPGTPAEAAGILQGDIIVSIDGTPVTEQGDVVVILRQKKVGDTITLVLDRKGTETTVKATLVERPASLQ
jgi:S1-C subfamily serine protease